MNKSEMRKYLIGKGFWIYDKISNKTTSTTKIEWNGIRAGYLFNDVRLFDDTEPRSARLISVRYTHPRCLERVDRIILYLKTADRRRERRMRHERAKNMKKYFDQKKVEAKLRKGWALMSEWNFKPEEMVLWNCLT